MSQQVPLVPTDCPSVPGDRPRPGREMESKVIEIFSIDITFAAEHPVFASDRR